MSGTLRSWGWITVIICALQLLAVAVAVLGLNAIGQMLVIPAYPACLLMIITMDVVALYSPTARAGPPEPMMRRGQRAVVPGKGPGGGGRR